MTTRRLLPIIGQPNPGQPKDIHLVGRYAVGVTWADSHGSIYPFEQLRRDDPATPADPAAPLTQEMTWPRDIKKLPTALRVMWADGHESLYEYEALRGRCRCAGCTGGH